MSIIYCVSVELLSTHDRKEAEELRDHLAKFEQVTVRLDEEEEVN